MFRVLQIKCRLHESQMRERDVSLDQAPLQRGRDDKKSFCPDKCKTIKARILLVDLIKREGILLFLLFFVLINREGIVLCTVSAVAVFV
jgi:hypothetical protein